LFAGTYFGPHGTIIGSVYEYNKFDKLVEISIWFPILVESDSIIRVVKVVENHSCVMMKIKIYKHNGNIKAYKNLYLKY
jgi:hypothetical protein